jgi:hypothetical protein
MGSSLTPIWEQIAIVLIGPPVMACAWWILSRGWARIVQGGTTSEKTKRRQKVEFWGLLIAMYAVTLGMTLYANMKR